MTVEQKFLRPAPASADADDTAPHQSDPPRRVSLVDGIEGPPRLGKYKVIAQLGEGGGATVYLAVMAGPEGVSKLLVVKVLKRQLASEPDFVRMFIDEARLSTRLNHPNIVQTIEVLSSDDRYFTVMEYLEGKPLSHLLGARIPGIGLNAIVHLIAEALGGLHYAHELADYDGTPLGVIHRDVSPQNIFVTYDGRAKLLDFGVAKMVWSNETELGVVKGKPRYMAPEQAIGGKVDRRADVFSAGVVLWEAVVGRRMWAGKHDMAVLYAVSNGHIPSLAEFAPEAPSDLARIITRALAQDRDERYPTALALQEDLEAYLRIAGETVTPRAIGRSLTQHFTSDRAHIKAAIDAQLGAMGASSSREFRVVSLADRTPGDVESYDIVIGDAAAATPSMSTVISPTPPAPKGRLSTLFFAVVLTAAAAAAFIWWQRRAVQVTSTLSAPSTVAAPAPTVALTAPAPVPLAPPPPPLVPSAVTPPALGAAANQRSDTVESATLALKANPPQAHLFLDGKPLESNPFTGRFPKDGAPHVLRAEASGYLPRETRVVLSEDGFFELTLVRRGSPAGGSPVAPSGGSPSDDVSPERSATPPAVPTAAPSAARSPKKRAVDRNDPYAQ